VKRTLQFFAAAFLAGACAPQVVIGGESSESGSSEATSGAEEGTESTESDSTTEESTTDAGFIGDGDGDGDEGMEPPPTCGDMLDCVFEECVLAGFDLACVGDCGMGASPEEVAEAGALLACIGGVCFDQGECSIQDLLNEDCIGCIGFGLFLPEPPGCVDEAMACNM
jgi:hypothetical protein